VEQIDALADDDADEEVEDDLEEQAVDDLLADAEADEVVEEFGGGRRRMASRMRHQIKENSTDVGRAWDEGHKAGYLQALRDVGMAPQRARDAYGSIGAVKRAVRSAASATGHVLKGFAEGAEQAIAGQVDQFLSPPVTDALPPVYVADDECLDFEGDELLEDECMGGLRTQDTYGCQAKYGFVGGHPRKAQREAAQKALARSGKTISSTKRSGQKTPFIEDPEAEPVLYGSGVMVDPIHGELCAVPCPSCSGLAEDAARYGADTDCVVCEGFGAILVPSSDVDDWFGAASYGIAPLVLAAGKGAWMLSKKHLFPAAKKAVQRWLSNSAESAAVEASVDFEAVSPEEDPIVDDEGISDVPVQDPVSGPAVRVLLPE
jgi:hypothetical protein